MNSAFADRRPENIREAVEGEQENLDMDKATDIPMSEAGLQINCGRDGTWLHFRAASGLNASICVENMEHGPIFRKAMADWCSDRQAQAAAIRAREEEKGNG